MKFENTKVFNIDGALRGMRNPLESWNKGDSYMKFESDEYYYVIGDHDMDLAKRLIKGGSEHRKFMRQILISVDITAPIYWWKEFDTYKIGTTANSTSTMHKLTSKPITRECFEMGDHEPTLALFDREPYNYDEYMSDGVETIIDILETLRLRYLETKDVRYWKELVRWLPQGWLQTRTITMNYENLYNMVNQRDGHKLIEWREDFINWAKTLPYTNEFIFDNLKK